MEDRIQEIVAASNTVPGWTEGEDARRLVLAALEAEDDPTIVEIGAFMGRCTVLLGAACRLRGSGKVFCFDPFDCSGDAFSVLCTAVRKSASGALPWWWRRAV